MNYAASAQPISISLLQALNVLLLLISFSASATPPGTHSPRYIFTIGFISAFKVPDDFVCEGNSKSAVFTCVDQIREYNTGLYPIVDVLSLYTTSGPYEWEGQYTVEDDDIIRTGKIDFNFPKAICDFGGDYGYDDDAREAYCGPTIDTTDQCYDTKQGNPFSIYTGEKFETVTDISGEGPFPIEFRRDYHSLSDSLPDRLSDSVPDPVDAPVARIGNRWDHNYSSFITGLLTSPLSFSWFVSDGTRKSFDDEVQELYDSNPNAFKQTALIHRPDGDMLAFANYFDPYTQCYVSDRWESRNASSDHGFYISNPCDLESDYIYINENEVREIYSLNGLLRRIEDPSGIQQELNYNGWLLEEVKHSLGYAITFDYIGNRISTITDSNDRVWTYHYDAAGNLQYVDSPDSTTTEYHYEDPVHPSAMTGITDRRGIRYAYYHYDTSGRLESEYHGDYVAVPEEGINGLSVQYDVYNGRIDRLKNSRGYTTDYWRKSLNGYELPDKTQGPGCATCGLTGLFYEYFPDTYDLMRLTENGQVTRFDNYNITGNPELVIEAEGAPEQRSISYTYDARYVDKVETRTEPSVYAAGSKVTSYSYDDHGNTTSVGIAGYRPDGTPVSRSQSFIYNGPYHQLSEIDGPRSDVVDITTIDYYPDSAIEGHNRARIRKVTAPLGVVLYDNIIYTATGQYETYTTGANLRVDFSYYPGNDRLETQTLTDLSTGEARTTSWTYLATGEVETITQGDATPDTTTLTFAYDDARRLRRVYDSNGNYIEYILDTEGNVINENIHNPGGVLLKALNRSFDAYNRLDISAQANESLDQDYSQDGTLDLETDGKSVITDYGYDALRRLTSITQDLGGTDPSSANALTQLGYDVHDNLTSVIDPNGGETSYVYDDLGNLLSMTSPDTGTASYTHDEAGNIASMIDAKDQLFNYDYDALDRVTLADAPGTVDDVAYAYDTCENGAGRLCSVTRDIATVTYAYTAHGEIRSSTQAVATFPGYEQAITQVSYNYNAAGRLRDLTYPGGNKVTYNYDADGNVYSVTLNDGDVNLVTEALYNPFGSASRITRGNGSVIFGYLDQAYRPFVIGNGTFYDVIHYDENGNPTTFYSSEGNKVHDYDALNRLDTSSGPFGARDYDYDSNGNRTGKTSDSITDSYSYDPNSNRMNTNAGSAVVLDANGNTTGLYGMTLNYTADNRLASITGSAAYTYNGLGERVMKGLLAPGTAGSYGFREKTVYTYDQNGKLLAELGSSGKVKQEYIYMNDELLATIVYKPHGGEPILNADMDGDGAVGVDDYLIWYFNHYLAGDLSRDINADGLLDTSDYNLVLNCALSGGTAPGCFTASYSRSIYYAHNDHLGTPHLLTDEAGVVVWSAIYDPFGEAAVNEDLDGDGNVIRLNIRFPGQYYDAESGLHYNYFRYYDPEVGRYLTSDPIGLIGGVNTYGYVSGSPLKWIDPYGLTQANSWDHLVYPPTTNCSFVIDCIKRLEDEESKIPDYMDPTEKGKRKIPKPSDVIKEIVNDYQNTVQCGFMNACPCGPGDTSRCEYPDGWPEPEKEKANESDPC